jgi:hypothetical protein
MHYCTVTLGELEKYFPPSQKDLGIAPALSPKLKLIEFRALSLGPDI